MFKTNNKIGFRCSGFNICFVWYDHKNLIRKYKHSRCSDRHLIKEYAINRRFYAFSRLYKYNILCINNATAHFETKFYFASRSFKRHVNKTLEFKRKENTSDNI